MALAELPGGGWTFDYAIYERPRLGRDVLRPVVPVGLGPRFRRGIVGLVDSGSEHTLASMQLAEDMGLDLSASTSRLKLGIGGRSAEAIFAPVQIRLYRDHSDEEFVSWSADIGFLTPWDAEFYVILGQVGFFDEFTVSMSRRLLATHIGPVDAMADKVNSTR